MARARNIKPGILKNEVLGVADPLLTLLFEGLWLLADREGRLEDRPLRIKAEVFPYRDGIDMDAMLNWLQASGFIRRYEAQGKRLVVVLEFVKHQNPHKNEPESVLPPPDEIGTAPELIGSTRADSLIPDSLIEDVAAPATAAAPPAAPAPAPKSKRRPVTTSMPEEFGISERVADWAKRKGFGQLPAHLESFRSKCAAKAYAYADWDEAFMGAIREDWAKVRSQPGHSGMSLAPMPVTVRSDAAERTRAEQDAAAAEFAANKAAADAKRREVMANLKTRTPA